ncbi:MAG: PilZ domain-containing protein [Candidatus Eremiobacteraeota bacterium]|nr:PilZ domain-containing protein [Candidatus Eremiobacteraeota bacterium]MBV8205026.1 PilZ domain-containing protein [Candidatus Eremiobacteraeota bacterium]MBV8460705.1 PilZ domain-containing protein [Candidatus Eremiobacteraeota bacterium]MBV8595376.1 PilZ domain-containing protein [Candidatus Eremiobacteraeota bacterium]MBV8669571.1 PilZ domain-containing protein [Candidatus Eremiobacteraeota bacterium]
MEHGDDGRPVERRKHARIQKTLPVHIRSQNSDERHAAEIVNIGGGGVLLRTDATVDTNDQLTIELDLVGESKPISVFGTVVRNDARGVGVSFVRISEITSDLIAYLIRKWEREGAHPA